MNHANAAGWQAIAANDTELAKASRALRDLHPPESLGAAHREVAALLDEVRGASGRERAELAMQIRGPPASMAEEHAELVRDLEQHQEATQRLYAATGELDRDAALACLDELERLSAGIQSRLQRWRDRLLAA